MKEIEEKAKRYDEALKVAREYWDSPRTCIDINVLPELFSELKESEDEKIRKALIKLVKKVGEGYENVIEGVSIENAISWLEKQGEHANFRNKIQIGDKVTRNEDGVLVNLSQLNRVAKKQGEQKPIPKFKVGDVVRSSNGESLLIEGITDYCYNCVISATNDEYSFGFDIQDEFELVEQKPTEWSEEDETTKNNISHIIRQYDKISKRENQPCYYVGDCLLWMQNIKDRVQPKQEWSEEDEEILNEIIVDVGVLKEQDTTKGGKAVYQEEIDWLKSLRPQSYWKPSVAQIEALNYVVNLMASSESPKENDYYYNVLKDLRRQLKKL